MLHYRVHRHMQETSSHHLTKSQCGMLCLEHIGQFFECLQFHVQYHLVQVGVVHSLLIPQYADWMIPSS